MMYNPFMAPWQYAVIVLVVIFALIPMVKILRRMGFSGWWAVIAVISPLNIIGLWYLAYWGWPTETPKFVK